MNDLVYQEFRTILVDLDLKYLIAICSERQTQLDKIIAAEAWDAMNLIVSSVGQAMTNEDNEEPFDLFDGYYPHFLNNDGSFEMIRPAY